MFTSAIGAETKLLAPGLLIGQEFPLGAEDLREALGLGSWLGVGSSRGSGFGWEEGVVEARGCEEEDENFSVDFDCRVLLDVLDVNFWSWVGV